MLFDILLIRFFFCLCKIIYSKFSSWITIFFKYGVVVFGLSSHSEVVLWIYVNAKHPCSFIIFPLLLGFIIILKLLLFMNTCVYD